MYFIDSRGNWGKKWYGQYRSDRTVSDAPDGAMFVSAITNSGILIQRSFAILMFPVSLYSSWSPPPPPPVGGNSDTSISVSRTKPYVSDGADTASTACAHKVTGPGYVAYGKVEMWVVCLVSRLHRGMGRSDGVLRR